jgi:hypothetical protein
MEVTKMAEETYLYVDGDKTTSAKKGPDGLPLTDTEGRSVVAPVVLQNAVTVAGNGDYFDVKFFKTLNIKVTGTSTSRTVIFEAAHADGVYEQIMGIKPATFDPVNQTTENNVSFQFDVTGYTRFRARVSAIAGGNVSVKGNAVS